MVVKDAREVGYVMEADIEISVGKMKGLAKIKIYGPSKSPTKKNQCTNFISKYPNLDPNISTKLSRKIVRPLIESYLKGQSWKEKIQPFNSINKDRIKCTECEKSFEKRYIRTHVEKMHNNICDVCNNIFKSAYKLKEHKFQIHKHTPKLVFKDTTNKVLVQPKQVQLEDSVKTHEEKTSPIHMAQAHECKQCNVSFTTKVELYEHNEKLHIHDTWPDSGSKRDVSLIKTSSVSEPKRKKAAEEDDMIERSRNMDRKIEEKRKKNDLEEMLRKKELEEKQRQEQIKTEIEEKRRNNEQIKEKKKREKEINHTKLPPNVRELPACVRRLYHDSLQFCVPGDGACCLNCVAAWILLDVLRGPQLARDLNTHLAEYREYYIEKLTFPLTITSAGGERRIYDEGEENEFFEMLVTSPEACFMWRGSADVIALADFTQMKIEIAVYNQHTDKVEQIQNYEPDLGFPWKPEDANAPRQNNYSGMKLLNYKNTHFDLIVKKGHSLLCQVPLDNRVYADSQEVGGSTGPGDLSDDCGGAGKVQEKEGRENRGPGNIQEKEVEESRGAKEVLVNKGEESRGANEVQAREVRGKDTLANE